MKNIGILKTTALLICAVFVAMLMLTACSSTENGTTGASEAQQNATVTVSPVVDDVTVSEATGDFTLTTSDGTYTQNGSIYTISTAGTYTLSGALAGQILVEAGSDDVVCLDLSGVTITNDADSPIKILSASSVEISSKSGSDNVIKDTRSTKTTDSDSQGEAAIYAKADLKLKGTGTLVVSSTYNNAVHTTKDLTIQKLTLKAVAYNNAFKGGDSVTVKSGKVVAISTNGNGVKTENTDADKNGNVRGDILFEGGEIAIYAAGDGVEAAHDFSLAASDDGSTAAVSIYTGTYSEYTADSASTTSYKGVKVQNELNISAGSISVNSYDDALHADYGTSFTAGGKGQGTINISGGIVSIGVYSPTAAKESGGSKGGRGNWGGQQTVSGADAIHADYKLNISGGVIDISSSYEGLEANVITVSGGSTCVAASDDGVNACKGVETPQILVTGGCLDVTVSPNGDTDGIDSNGSYKQTGGFVITRGPNSEMAAALDADVSVTISGGTLVVLGYGRVSTSGSVKSYSLSLQASGSHTVTVGSTTYTFTNAAAYGKTAVYSDQSVSA